MILKSKITKACMGFVDGKRWWVSTKSSWKLFTEEGTRYGEVASFSLEDFAFQLPTEFLAVCYDTER